MALRNPIKNLSIIVKLLLLNVVIMLILVVGINFIVIFGLSNVLKKQEIAIQEQIQDDVIRILKEKYNLYFNYLIEAHNKGGAADLLVRVFGSAQEDEIHREVEELERLMEALAASDPDIQEVFLLTEPNHPIYGSLTRNHPEPFYSFSEDPVFRRAFGDESFITLFQDQPGRYMIKDTPATITFVGKVFDPSLYPGRRIVGHLVINFSPAFLREILKKQRLTVKGDWAVTTKAGEILYSTREGVLTTASAAALREGEVSRRIDGVDYLFSTAAIWGTPLKVVNILSEREIWAPLNRILRQMILLVTGGFFLAFGLTYLALRLFSRRFYEVLKAFEEVEQGNLDLNLPVTCGDEIGRLRNRFNLMCRNLSHHIERVYAVEIQRKEMENRFLQSQINPHFLYNTLEQIRTRAITAGDGELGRMITLLGGLFRWNSRMAPQIVTVEEELEQASAYLELQKLRLKEKLMVEIQEDPAVLDAGIPKMVLQPLVENAVTHGEAKTPPTRVSLALTKAEKNLQIVIEDNGPGIKPATWETLMVQPRTNQRIGLMNVHQRLRLLFGPPYGLSLLAPDLEGARIALILPYLNRTEMERYDKDLDR